MNAVFGEGNEVGQYVLVVAFYAALVLTMLRGSLAVELNARRHFMALYVGWVGLVIPGNYLFYRLGWMSFLPWANNIVHCAVWIGLCLGYLYTRMGEQPRWQQFAAFAIYSFLVKYAERQLLGTWELDHFFFVPSNTAYLIGWSLMDGLYPVISDAGLRLTSRWVPSVVFPTVPSA